MLFPISGSKLKSLKCNYPPIRRHGVTTQKTVNSVRSFLELYIQMAGLTMTTKDQIAAAFGMGV